MSLSGRVVLPAAADGDLVPRLLLLEAQGAEQQQQLSAIAGQQDALREVFGRLVESLEAANLQATSSTRAELQELSQQVRPRPAPGGMSLPKQHWPLAQYGHHTACCCAG